MWANFRASVAPDSGELALGLVAYGIPVVGEQEAQERRPATRARGRPRRRPSIKANTSPQEPAEAGFEGRLDSHAGGRAGTGRQEEPKTRARRRAEASSQGPSARVYRKLGDPTTHNTLAENRQAADRAAREAAAVAAPADPIWGHGTRCGEFWRCNYCPNVRYRVAALVLFHLNRPHNIILDKEER